MIPKPHLKQLLSELLRLGLPSYTWHSNFNPPAFPFQEIDLYGEVEEEGKIIKRLYAQIEPNLSESLLQTHSIVRHELAKKGFLHSGDEYWLVTGTSIPTDLKKSAAQKHIILHDLTWLRNQTRRYYPSSQKLRQIGKTLSSQGFPLSSQEKKAAR